MLFGKLIQQDLLILKFKLNKQVLKHILFFQKAKEREREKLNFLIYFYSFLVEMSRAWADNSNNVSHLSICHL